MPAYSKLEPYELSRDKAELLQQSFTEPPPMHIPELEVYKKRPKPSELRSRVMGDLAMVDLTTRHPPQAMAAVLRSVHRTWENFYEGSVSPSEFMRTPFGAPYEIVSVAGKGRGVVASRDITAGEVVLQDTPVLVLPPECTSNLLFLTLPQKALEAILLLHNAKPGVKRFSADLDIPLHRLMDLLSGVLDSNCFGTIASCGFIGVLLLTGSLFNHSNKPNLTRAWNNTTEKLVFTSVRDIKEGEELEVDYVPHEIGVARAERLKAYGIS